MTSKTKDVPLKIAVSAFDLFGLHGINNVSMDDIAAHMGVTKGCVYRHYSSKKEVILAACSHYYRTWQMNLNRENAKVPDPWTRLQNRIRLAVRNCLRNDFNRRFTLELFHLTTKDEDIRRSWAQFYDQAQETLIGLVEEVKASGKVPIKNPRKSVPLYLNALEGLKMRAAFEPHLESFLDEETVYQGLMDIIINIG